MGSDRPLSDSVDQHYQGLVQDKTKSPKTPGLKEGIHPKVYKCVYVCGVQKIAII